MLETIVTAFVTFFVIIDPLGTVPVFVSLTRGADEATRRHTAIKGSTIAICTLILFAIVGDYFLDFLGITLAAFRIAGGALLFLLSIDMLFARHTGLRSTTASEEKEAVHKLDVAVFPLAIPLIAGPGAITSVILLMGHASGQLLQQLSVIIVLLVVLALNLGALLLASKIMRFMGVTGINVIGRVFGIILAALAMQFIIDGIIESFPGLVKP